MISGGGRSLQNLIDLIAAGKLNARIAVVISSLSKVQGVERARAAGLPVEIVRRKDHADVASFSQAIVDVLERYGVQLAVQAGWTCLWQLPERWYGRVMNIHPALLPKYGGKGCFGHHVHEAVLAAGDAESGCTVHFANNEYDAGPIILQRRVSVLPGDTPDALAARVFEQECIAYPEAIRLFAEGRLRIEGNRVRVGV
ncbi:MAG: phosphoribosylglycinamide formyltransferase [Planctomycetes bacterium]|nr:phosphoribosylglycinamide formyltransferase [Planctomycetota bacterium]